jgi:hypothetical protein
MWLGPALFIGVSILLWKFLGAIFVPELMARAVFRLLPVLTDMEMVIIINSALIYFAAYFVFAIFWTRLKPYLKNPFLAGMLLWLVNVLVVLPVLGRGVMGYLLPQGWISVSFPLVVSHWMFARGLQLHDRRLTKANQTLS